MTPTSLANIRDWAKDTLRAINSQDENTLRSLLTESLGHTALLLQEVERLRSIVGATQPEILSPGREGEDDATR